MNNFVEEQLEFRRRPALDQRTDFSTLNFRSNRWKKHSMTRRQGKIESNNENPNRSERKVDEKRQIFLADRRTERFRSIEKLTRRTAMFTGELFEEYSTKINEEFRENVAD